MKVICKNVNLEKATTPALILGLHQGETKMKIEKNAVLKKFCDHFLMTNDYKGELGETTLLYTDEQLSAQRILLIGLGEKEKINTQRLRKAGGVAANYLKKIGIKTFAIAIETFIPAGTDAGRGAQTVIEGMMTGIYEYNQFKSPENPSQTLEELVILYERQESREQIEFGAQTGKTIAEAINFSRDLQNHPGNWLTPTRLAEFAQDLATEVGLDVQVLDKSDMEKLGMGALLGVARGSNEPPKFIILQHHARKKDLQPIVFVGKGITFDSGGISIKPSSKMEEMKFDMSGAAAVLGAMKAIAELDLPFHVVGLIPSAENLPSSTSMKPGDILKASSGTTIEVVNTDAEGRLILADALAYAKRYNPHAVIDLATLTGACVIALGHHATGLMGNDQALIEDLKQAGEECGEPVWQLPLWDDYYEDIKSDYADIKNSAGRPGGAITAAAFLGRFAEDYPWAHLDIAGTAWLSEKQEPFAKGGTGVGVRLLVQFLRNMI